jgi:hypothetical protein
LQIKIKGEMCDAYPYAEYSRNALTNGMTLTTNAQRRIFSELAKVLKMRRFSWQKAVKLSTTMGVLVCVLCAQAQVKRWGAMKDLLISSGESCNDPSPSGVTKYLENTNVSRVIQAKVRSIRTPSEGRTEVQTAMYSVRPEDRIKLGCSREGGGAPVIVDISWEILSATYK